MLDLRLGRCPKGMFNKHMTSIDYAEEDDISNQELRSKLDILIETKDI